jgi:hypothetical protein
LHDRYYETTKETIYLTDWNITNQVDGHCAYRLQLYTSATYWTESTGNSVLTFTLVVSGTFLLVLLTFGIYDLFVQRRQNKVVSAALRSHAMIASLFPSNVRARLFDAEVPSSKAGSEIPRSSSDATGRRAKTLKGFLTTETPAESEENEKLGYEGKPIADLCKFFSLNR